VKSLGEAVFLVAYVLCIYVALPVVMLGGWIRWVRQPKLLTTFSVLSMIGFFLATASALLAFGGLLYAHAIGGFPFYDPRLMRLYRWGGQLSLAGIILGIIGCFHRNTLRWYAPICSVGVFIFWCGAAMGE
jgi:hypothetical protein